MIGCSTDGSSSSIQVPGSQVKLDRTCRRTPWLRAYSTERISGFGQPAAHISSISSNETAVQAAGARHRPRGSAVNTPGTSVYNSQALAPRAAARATAVVSEPPRPRKVTLLSVDTPWAPPTTGTRPAATASRMRRGPNVEDLGPGVLGVGDNPGLAAGEGVCRHAEVVQGHGQQGHGLALAGGDEHVHLPARAGGRHLGGQIEQLVGLLAHGADDHDDLVAAPPGPGHVVGHAAYAIGVGDRGAPELLHEQLTHDSQGYQRLLGSRPALRRIPLAARDGLASHGAQRQTSSATRGSLSPSSRAPPGSGEVPEAQAVPA